VAAAGARRYLDGMYRIAIVVVIACSHPRAEPPPALDALAADLLAKTPAAGVSIAVVRRGETIVAKGYGFADADRRTPVTPASVFRIGSITKQFAAAAILRLAAAHRLSLDDDLHRYLPDYPAREPITLRQLLAHTSGIHDYEHSAWLREHMAEHRPRSELVAAFAAEPLDFAPGTKWAYSNSGYYLLGLVIERVTGHPWADYVTDMVGAAGVAGIRNCPDEQDYPNAARGYDLDAGHRVPTRPIAMAHAFTAGDVCATASGLVAWERALATGRVVDAASWRAMTTPVTLTDGATFGYGLGLFLGDLGGHRMIFHGGGVNGFVSTLAYFPDDDVYIAVLVNTDGNFADDLGEAIARNVLGVPRGKPTATPVPDDAIIGHYDAIGVGIALIIERDAAGKLVAHKEGGEPRPLVREADGSYTIPGRGQLTFKRDGDRVTGFTYVQAGMTFEARRAP
jgi:CubicO group peptidase (beta-lactamase class C family)